MLRAEKPASARSVSWPLAPAARTRLIVSAEEARRATHGVGRSTPQPGVQHVPRVRGHRQQRVIAAGVGVGEGRAALCVQAIRSQMVESSSMVSRSPRGPRRPRRKVPQVEAAFSAKPSMRPLPPARQASTPPADAGDRLPGLSDPVAGRAR